ncbi:MAG: CBS domain-containing protein [Gammaproteobacteria bacterium]|jgi:CBS domain-containing protein
MNKNISEFVSDEIAITIDVNATVMDAVSVMTSAHHNYVLVTDNGSTVGIFTDRDLLNRVTSEKRMPAEVAIRDVMTPNPDTLKTDDYISYAIEKMGRNGFRNIPIKNEAGTTSVLTVWNIMSHLSEILDDAEQAENDKEIVDEITDTGGG